LSVETGFLNVKILKNCSQDMTSFANGQPGCHCSANHSPLCYVWTKCKRL